MKWDTFAHSMINSLGINGKQGCDPEHSYSKVSSTEISEATSLQWIQGQRVRKKGVLIEKRRGNVKGLRIEWWPESIPSGKNRHRDLRGVGRRLLEETPSERGNTQSD